MTRSRIRHIRDGSIALGIFASVWMGVLYVTSERPHPWSMAADSLSSWATGMGGDADVSPPYSETPFNAGAGGAGSASSKQQKQKPFHAPEGIVLATVIHNERANIREWVDFNIMSGVNHQIVYDYDSNDNVRDVLSQYIAVGNVTLIQWPPAEADPALGAGSGDEVGAEPIEPELAEAYSEAGEKCLVGMGNLADTRRECQRWAGIDALSRARQMDSRWFGLIGPGDFLYPNEESPEVTLAGVLRSEFATTQDIQISTLFFGANGNTHRPVRQYGDLYSSMAIETLLRRTPEEWAIFQTILNPMHDSWASFIGKEAKARSTERLRINRYDFRSLRDTSNTGLWLSGTDERPEPPRAYNEREDKLLQKRASAPLAAILQARHVAHPPHHSDDWEPDLFDLHETNRPLNTSERIPDLCLAVMSCRRLGLARRTISAAIRYMARIEPELTYELVLVDNGSGPSVQWQLERDFPFDKTSYYRNNEGIPSAINTLYFGLCRAPHIITLEDDWIARWETWREDLPYIKMALSVMKQDDMISAVWLKDFNNRQPGLAENRTGLLEVPESGAVYFPERSDVALPKEKSDWPRKFQWLRQQHAKGFEWGVYINGAAVHRRDILEKTGPMLGHRGGANGDRSEWDYADRINEQGYAAGILCNPADGTQTCPEDYLKEAWGVELLFEHGGTKGRSPGHVDHP